MKKNILLTAAALVTTLAGVAQWQPAGDRIRTQWGEKLDPQNVLPEYPRPQMVRGDWQNLNGLSRDRSSCRSPWSRASRA